MEVFLILGVVIAVMVIVGSSVGSKKQNKSNPGVRSKKARTPANVSLLNKKIIGNNLRIIYESAKIVENTTNYDTFYSRLGVMLKMMSGVEVFVSGSLQSYYLYYTEMFDKCQVLEERRKQVFEHVHLNNNDITCPHCGYTFDNPVNRKRKCPECKEDIYRVKDKQGVYLVKEEVKEYYKPKIYRTDKVVEQRFVESFPDLFRDYKAYFMEENIY